MSKLSSVGSTKPTALLLSPEAPYPAIGGGALRIASILEYLCHYYTVDLIVFSEPGAPNPLSSFPAGRFRHTDVLHLPYHRKDSASRAVRNVGRLLRGSPPLVDRFSGFENDVATLLASRHYDVGIIEHFWCAAYGKILRHACDRVVLDLHNIESILLNRSAQAEHWAAAAALRHFAKSCRRLEKQWFDDFHLLLVTSDNDLKEAARIHSSVPAFVCPNTIPWVPLPSPEKQHAIAFSGNMEYHPNTAAIQYFFDNVWPRLLERWPKLEWRLIGKNPQAIPDRIRNHLQVKVIGPVDDAINAIAVCRCAVVPLLAGSGTRIKIIEAWAAGIPVVSTSIGAEGLPCSPGQNILIADAPSTIADAVSSLLEDFDLAETVGRSGRLQYESELTWASAALHLKKAGL